MLDVGTVGVNRPASQAGRVADLTGQRERFAEQWARIGDAGTYLRLAAPGAEGSAPELADLAARAPRADLNLQAVDRALDETLAAERTWWATGPAADAARLREAMARIDAPLAASLQEASRDFLLVEQAASQVMPGLEKAEAAARREWEAAYLAVYGRPAQVAPAAAAPPAPMAAPARPPPVAMVAAPDIRGHAYQEFDAFDREDPDYAAYTYVLLRYEGDLATPGVLRRCQSVLSVVRVQTLSSEVRTRAERERLHLFCLPMRARTGSTPSLYHSALGNQLKLNAQTGLLTNVALKQRLIASPGPFLLTLPTRIASTSSSTAVLFADLAPYLEDAVADMIVSYMSGLLRDFPRDQALWQPPVLQRVTLTIFQLVVATGSLLQASLPSAQAQSR